MRLLITGGTGFIGSALARCLAGSDEVAVLARRPPAVVPPGIRFLAGDVANPDWAVLEAYAPEAVVHAAWIATPGVYLESPENEQWVDWSLRFLGRLAEGGTRHFTVLGTCIEYAMTGLPLVEEVTPLDPRFPYSRAKVALHRELAPRLARAGARLAWARIFYPYGEGEHPARLCSSLLARLRAGQPVQLRTPDSVKDYVHVEDVARALETIVRRQFTGAINVGTGEGVSVATVAGKIAALLGRPDLVQRAPEAVRDPLDHVVADATRLRGLGWRPQVGLDAGLRRLVQATST